VIAGGSTIVRPGAVWTAWQWTASIVVPLALCAAWYAIGVRALWRRAGVGRGVRRWQVWCFAGGVATLAIALLSPVDALAETLFSAHMVQHLLLMLVAAPLLALGEPLLPALWALPGERRLAIGRWWRASPRARRAVRAGCDPLGVWLANLAVLWFWHLPGPYLAALGDERLHALEHLTFLGAAFLFWWVVFQPIGRRRLAHGGAVVYLARGMAPHRARGPTARRTHHVGSGVARLHRRRARARRAVVRPGPGAAAARAAVAWLGSYLRFFGTLAPFFRASDNPIAIACFRLFTFPPWPDLPRRSVPFLRRCIALFTRFDAAFPYFRELCFFRECFLRVAMSLSLSGRFARPCLQARRRKHRAMSGRMSECYP